MLPGRIDFSQDHSRSALLAPSGHQDGGAQDGRRLAAGTRSLEEHGAAILLQLSHELAGQRQLQRLAVPDPDRLDVVDTVPVFDALAGVFALLDLHHPALGAIGHNHFRLALT